MGKSASSAASKSGAISKKGVPLYIEIFIAAPLESVWELSQNPVQHPRWDLRFTRIVPESIDSKGNTHFRYEFELPFHTIRGTGVSLGHQQRVDGQATSVLKFDTEDWISPIGQGSGYWRYVPSDSGIRFITGYNYEPGLGFLGKALDSWLIRPALGWATALSFDRLRLWAESDLTPEASLRRWALDAGARTGLLAASGALAYRAIKRQSPLAAVGSAAAVVLPLVLKVHWSVPRAGRCLRTAPDQKSATAPSSLTTLANPKSNTRRK